MKLLLAGLLLFASLRLCAAQTPSLTLTWTAGAGSTSANVASFQVQESTTSGGPYTTIASVAFASGQTTYSVTWTGGTCNTTYFFVQEAIGPTTAPGTSLPSPQSTAVFPCNLPPTPSIATITINP
jgi:hypothetical protein